MKSLSIDFTVGQVKELKIVINYLVDKTDAMHHLNYGEAVVLQRAFMKLVNKSHSMTFRKQNKKYKVAFVPIEAEVVVKFIDIARSISGITLSYYAETTILHFSAEVARQGANLMTTFMSQFPFDTPDAQHQYSKNFRDKIS